MKKCILLICLIAATAAAQYPPRDTDVLKEKRFLSLQAEEELYWMDSTNGDLWTFDRAGLRWRFIGSPRSANTRRKGVYQLVSLKPGELLILDTDSGEAWWTDLTAWVIIDDPSTRTRREDRD